MCAVTGVIDSANQVRTLCSVVIEVLTVSMKLKLNSALQVFWNKTLLNVAPSTYIYIAIKLVNTPHTAVTAVILFMYAYNSQNI